MANKIAGLTYVDEFTFSPEQGFTGSAGKHNVRGYYRGGAVKKDHVKAAAQNPRAPGPGAAKGGYLGDSKKGMPKNVKARGGTVGVTTPRRGKSMPQQASQEHYAAKSAAKGHGGAVGYAEGGSVHDNLYAEGAKMGYARGGTVKNTSAEFVQTSGKQATMDNANYPPGHPSSARDQESGPRKKLRPKFKKGGGVHHVRDVDPSARRKASGKGMPKGVKARGGLAKYAAGGYATGGIKKGDEAGSAIELTLGKLKGHISKVEGLAEESLAASRAVIGKTTAPPADAGDPPLLSLDNPPPSSTATEAAKTASPPEPSIKQTGVGEHNEPTFGRKMRPVMHVDLKAGGGVVSAARGGKKKAARRARGGRR